MMLILEIEPQKGCLIIMLKEKQDKIKICTLKKMLQNLPLAPVNDRMSCCANA